MIAASNTPQARKKNRVCSRSPFSNIASILAWPLSKRSAHAISRLSKRAVHLASLVELRSVHLASLFSKRSTHSFFQVVEPRVNACEAELHLMTQLADVAPV